MPWQERTVMDQRKQFIEEWQRQQETFAEICRKHGVCRQTGYTLVERFKAEGWEGLEDLSRAPHHSPQAMRAEVSAQVIELRQAHPHWGPRKLRAYLVGQDPQEHWPAASSIGELLQRQGLV